MKKILIALFCLATFAAEAQIKQQLGTYGVRTRRMQADSAFKLPTFAVGIKDNYAGFDTAQLRYRFTDSTVLVYTGSQWIALGGGGGGTVYVDSVFSRNDSLYYKKNGSEYFVKKLQPYGTIAGLLSAGTNVTITGSGTTGSPYVISSSGGVQQADTIIYLSRSGVVSDADISEGSITFGTDNTTAIQAILDIASHTQSIKVIWDVKASITGLTIGPNTEIEALPGMGAILRNSSNKPMFVNRDTAFGRTPVDSFITINGGIWNGNGYNSGLNPAQTQGNSSTGLTNAFSMFGVYKLTIKNFTILRQRVYGIQGINLKNSLYSNGVIDCGSDGTLNTDGVHFDGGSENCIAENLKIKSNDDAFACNADDVYHNPGGVAVGYYPYTANADVKNIVFRDIVLDGGRFGGRLLSTVHRVDNILIENITGVTTGYAMLIGNFPFTPPITDYPGPGNFGTVTINGMNVQVNTCGCFGTVDRLITINGDADNIILENITRDYFNATNSPSVQVTDSANVRNLSLIGYKSYDTTAFVNSHVVVYKSTVGTLIITNASVKRKTSSNASALLEMFSGASIGNVIINGAKVDSLNHVFTTNSSTPTVINASGIVHISDSTSSGSSFDCVDDSLTLSNYRGKFPYSGTVAFAKGDAFMSGGVTSVATNTGTGITGGTITSTGTLAIDTANIISTRLQLQHIVDSLAATLGGGGITGTIGNRQIAFGAGASIAGTDSAKWAAGRLQVLGQLEVGDATHSMVWDNSSSWLKLTGTSNSGFKIDQGAQSWLFYMGAGGTGGFGISDYDAGADRFTINSSGNIQFNAYGAGTATFDASGNITSVSDPRVKKDIKRYTGGLSQLMQIKPITFRYNGISGNETKHTYLGFNAQNVFNVLGELGTGVQKINDVEYKTLQDRSLIALLINSVQEQQKQIDELRAEVKKLKNR